MFAYGTFVFSSGRRVNADIEYATILQTHYRYNVRLRIGNNIGRLLIMLIYGIIETTRTCIKQISGQEINVKGS